MCLVYNINGQVECRPRISRKLHVISLSIGKDEETGANNQISEMSEEEEQVNLNESNVLLSSIILF